MTFVPHFPCTIRMPAPDPAAFFSDSAVMSVIGQKFLFCGVTVVIKEAWVHHGEMLMTIDKVEEPVDLCPTCKETLPCTTCGAGL